jgi:hypothetical protein
MFRCEVGGIQGLSPAGKLGVESPAPRPVEGRHREAFVRAGRGAAPAGLATQVRHPGGIGVPPGTTRSPRQELADDLDARHRPLAQERAP